jgi:hypothetical protein
LLSYLRVTYGDKFINIAIFEGSPTLPQSHVKIELTQRYLVLIAAYLINTGYVSQI